MVIRIVKATSRKRLEKALRNNKVKYKKIKTIKRGSDKRIKDGKYKVYL